MSQKLKKGRQMRVLMEVSDYKDGFIAESIECLIDEEQMRRATVQLTDSLFKPQLNCEFITNDEFTEEEREEIIDKAEDYAIALRDKYKIIETNFNCAINNVSVSIYSKENDFLDQVFLVAVDDSATKLDYSIKYQVLKNFSTVKECEEYLQEFYTDEYNDFAGLRNLLNDDCED